MKSIELALSMCDIVDIYGFTVDPGYTEWSVYSLSHTPHHIHLKERKKKLICRKEAWSI